MNRLTPFALLLTVALVISGCKTVSPPPAATQTGSGNDRSANQDEYNRTYQTESHHRHHHGKRDQSSSDNWTSYDRAGTAEEPSGDSPGPAPDDSRGNGHPGTSYGRHHNSRAMTASPGQFDFYLLNLSWSPEFCHGHPAAAECAQHRAFTLHGLWPQNSDGTYPEDCSEAPGPTRPSEYSGIYPDPALLQHEWQTHGTCSGLPPDQFFDLARRAEQSVHVPVELAGLTQPTMLSPAQIITLFTQSNPAMPVSSLAISCGNNYLTAVEVCMDKNLKFESCSGVKTCGATQIRIPAPQ